MLDLESHQSLASKYYDVLGDEGQVEFLGLNPNSSDSNLLTTKY